MPLRKLNAVRRREDREPVVADIIEIMAREICDVICAQPASSKTRTANWLPGVIPKWPCLYDSDSDGDGC